MSHSLLTKLASHWLAHVVSPNLKFLIEAEDWAGISRYYADPADYGNPEDYWTDNFLPALLKKVDGLPNVTSEDLHGQAVKTFLSCEAQNCVTNLRLSEYLEQGNLCPADQPVLDFINRFQYRIRRILGPLPNRISPYFGGGSTFYDTGKLTTIPDKLTSSPGVTAEAYSVVASFLDETSWGRLIAERREGVCLTRGNRFTSVPKDSFKNRGICVEPSLNISFQLAVGKVLKARYRSHTGNDLSSAEARHQALARKGSVDGTLATLDLSNASDTMSKVLVKLALLQAGSWYDLLDSLRSKSTKVDGSFYFLEKFSSMGNGFTFELETIIFQALCETVVPEDRHNEVSVFGDDIIVPNEYADDVCAVLTFFGFTLNPKKSFWTGPFRESCGGDFFRGIPVRGPTLRKLPDGPQDWMVAHNAIRRACHSVPRRFSLVAELLEWCLAQVPSHIRRCVGPAWLGDIVFHQDGVEPTNRLLKAEKRQRGLEDKILGARCSKGSNWTPCYITFQPIPKSLPWDHWRPEVQLVSCTLGLSSMGVTPRGSVSGYRLRWASALTNDWLPAT